MTILESDVKFRASQRMTDFADGGGLMSTVTIVGGVDNNLFDDITDIERLFGSLSLRKVYGAVLSNNQDTYLSAHALADVPPADAATKCFLLATGGLTTERAGVITALTSGTSNAGIGVGSSYTHQNGTATLGSPNVTFSIPQEQFPSTYVGSWYLLYEFNGLFAEGYRQALRYLVSYGPGLGQCVFNEGLPWSGPVSAAVVHQFPGDTSGPTIYSVATCLGGASAGATSIEVDSVLAKIAPLGDGSAVAASYSLAGVGGTNAPLYNRTQGFVRAFRGGSAVLVSSTVSMTPAAVSNGQTVVTGRVNLARLRVIGNSGVVHASFVLNQPPPTGVGCTADLAAGTVTFTDVSGMSQPVTVEHRIEEMVLVFSVLGNTLTLNRALSRTYPAGTRVSSLLLLGDLKGRVGISFAQTAWTGVFADTVLGSSPAADFDIAGNPFVVSNQGAVNERWYCLFTNTATYRVIGEQLGEVGTGSTGTNYSPINPATGVPYFTIPAVGWGSGWAAGNVFRFNTHGANAPLWVGRSVAPSVPSGDDSVTLQLRGYVNT